MTETEETPPPELIETPADGVPELVETPTGFAAAVDRLRAGEGPLAVDTERAQSFRYSAKAYLIQLRRRGAGTVLVDPVALADGTPRADLTPLASALADVEWLIHAATQDLPCLAEVGLVPRQLFDTELAGRLLGLPRVSLTSLTERALGKTLLKEHSAADWSKRPLPQDWLVYAALDVELLADLRDWAAEELVRAGKQEWARQEFAHLAEHAADPVPVREDPWRRTSGIHDVRSPWGLAVVRELWRTRDEIARRLDRAPGRVLPDRAISELAQQADAQRRHLTRGHLRQVKGFGWRLAARHEADWVAALDRVAALTREDLPPTTLVPEGPPPPRTWAQRNPEAHERWGRVRPATVALAEECAVPVENLITPDTVRRLAWEPPADRTPAGVDRFLAGHAARPWQRELVVPVVTPLLG